MSAGVPGDLSRNNQQRAIDMRECRETEAAINDPKLRRPTGH
jgi:hypothetical protein